jgi:hypothetical protein
MTTASKVNKELEKQGIDCKMFKGSGYYYFMSSTIPTIDSYYSNNLHHCNTGFMVNYVKGFIKN